MNLEVIKAIVAELDGTGKLVNMETTGNVTYDGMLGLETVNGVRMVTVSNPASLTYVSPEDVVGIQIRR